MKKHLITLAALCCAALPLFADTDYPVDEAVSKANLAKVKACENDAYWKGAPFAAAVVEPMSGIRRTPDLFPEDGDFVSPMRIVAAQGEYEPGAFLLFPFSRLSDVRISAGDLVSDKGARIKASETDITVVKIWYQAGTAWGGFHADHLRRIPTPELMLHDETLIDVDHLRKENFARCDFKGGSSAYQWISFLAPIGDHKNIGDIRYHWIHDAKTLQPVSLQPFAFKQFIATVHVPANAPAGLYRGKITVAPKEGASVQIPVELRVLPFALPKPATFRDLDREFYASAYIYQNLADNPGIAENMVRHNLLNPRMPGVPTARAAKKLFDVCRETGLATNTLIAILPGAGLTTSYPVKQTDKNYTAYLERTLQVSNSLARIKGNVGDADAYASGVDEGGPGTVRAERATWQSIQSLGGKVTATTRFHPYLLFNLDMANAPRQPSPNRKLEADAFHAANPDALMSWYADPHSGPENPDYNRRLYGWVSWRNNYDMFCQYILFRNDWTDFWISKEPNLRGLILAYPQDGNMIDTLAWEGLREGVDDLRYGTLLKQLCEKARLSADVNTVYAGRAAATWIAQVDFERSSMKYLRLETISRILDLQSRLAKEEK